MWTHIGGGCSLMGGEYNCDDVYENEAEDIASVVTTQARHFKMPQTVESLDELRALEGVGVVDVREADE